ncbi:MAG: SDR family NAD(P)-dependent oxidoreductase [Alphaproteobacteria bacterium]
MGGFEGKCALITGAAGNLGSALARRFSRDGARVILFGRDQTAVDELAATLPGECVAVGIDLTDEAAVDVAIANVLAECGAIDILCAAAGGFDMGPPAHDTGTERWEHMHRVNVGTLLPVLGAVSRHMIERRAGRIVTVGANAVGAAVPGMAPYRAAKSAVMRITENASAELREHEINVNCVLPSILDTPQNRTAMPNADRFKWVSLDEMAAVIAFLSSDEASAIHGAMLPVVGRS